LLLLDLFTNIYIFFLGIKDFSNWPTIPQVYIDGDFVGGCDIMLQMHQNGELIDVLKKAGITSALVEEKKS
jgi:monothiol glutaredoxin